MPVDYPAETYNGHPARYLTDENGVVTGFVKPNTNGDRAPVPVWSASETALNGSGGIVRRAPSFMLYNPAGLHRWRVALGDALFSPPKIMCLGDSVTVGIDSDGANNSSQLNSTTDLYGWPAQLRRLMANYYRSNESGNILPNDERVTKGGTVNVAISGGWLGNPDGTKGGMASMTNASTLTFSLPACTAFDIWYCELKSTTAPNWSYTVDGGSANNVTGTNPGSSDRYAKTSQTGLSNAAHTVVITSGGSSVLIVGIVYYSDAGVVVMRSAGGGFTSSDALGIGSNRNYSANTDAQRRIKLANNSMASPALSIIAFGHNDATQQLTAGQLTTLSVYKDNLQTMITDVVSGGGCVLLLSEPDPPNADVVGGDTYRAYWDAAREVCDDNLDYVSHLRIYDEWGDWDDAAGKGLHNVSNNTVHCSRKGYGDIARMIFNALTSDTPAAQ